MAAPRITVREHPVEACPRCGSPRIGDVKPEDVGEDEELAAETFGLRQCHGCGVVIQVEA